MSAGGSSSNESSSSNSFTNMDSFISGSQLPFLQNMWQQSQGYANPGVTQGAAQAGAGAVLPGMQSAYGNIGALTDPTAQIDAQSSSLQAGLGQMFREQINPAIQTNAISAGGFGGGRQGVAEGVATGQLADAYTKGYGDIVSRANNTALGAGSMLPGMAQGIYDMNVNPTMAGLDPMAQLASILGNPAILNKTRSQSQGQSSGSSSGFEVGFGKLFG